MKSNSSLFQEIREEFKTAGKATYTVEDAALDRSLGTGIVTGVFRTFSDFCAPVRIPVKVMARRLGLTRD